TSSARCSLSMVMVSIRFRLVVENPNQTAIRTMTAPCEAVDSGDYGARLPVSRGCGRLGLWRARSAHNPYRASYTTSWDTNFAEDVSEQGGSVQECPQLGVDLSCRRGDRHAC